MSFSDVEHFSSMVSGCESLNAHFTGKGDIDNKGRYAFTVLKLHADDAGLVAGQEGFLDVIKKGAQTLKKWFLELLKAIGSFIDTVSGKNKRIAELEREIERKKKEAKEDKDRERALNEKLVTIFNKAFAEPQRLSEQTYDAIKATGYLDSGAFDTLNVSNMRIHHGYDAIKQLIYASKHDAPNTREISIQLGHLNKAIGSLSLESKKEVSTWKEEKEQESQRRAINAAAYLLKNFSSVLNWYTYGLDSYTKKAVEIK